SKPTFCCTSFWLQFEKNNMEKKIAISELFFIICIVKTLEKQALQFKCKHITRVKTCYNLIGIYCIFNALLFSWKICKGPSLLATSISLLPFASRKVCT